MRTQRLLSVLGFAGLLTAAVASCTSMHWGKEDPALAAARAQVPAWSDDDMAFFLHGSMSTEVVPEAVLRAFQKTYPEIYPTADFSYLGAIPDPQFGWPVGFSRSSPAHLGGVPSVGINCAACHVAEVESATSHARTRVLGITALFDAEGFFNSIVASGLKTQDPANMKRFLAAYVLATGGSAIDAARFNAAWEAQMPQIAAAMSDDPMGARGAGPGGLQKITSDDLHVDFDHPANTAVAMLKLFHNERAALHVPEPLPAMLPPPSGPGRNDAFGLLSAALFNSPQQPAPVKYGIVWNVADRGHVHWDGNTRLPIARNMLAAVGLGAPLIDKHAQLNFALVKRQTDITEHISPPRYPFAIDTAAAARGKPLFETNCLSCHSGPEDDHRLYSPADVGTDAVRATVFTPPQADKFNNFLATLETPGYTAPTGEPGIRSTGKYWSPSLAGVWARSPYLHDGSVRTMAQLLMPAAQRQTSFHRGSNKIDEATLGYTDEGSYLMDTTRPANGNAGHEYGTNLTPDQKKDLIEYLKTL